MNFIVRLEGFHPKARAAVEKMLRDDVATLPSRVSGLVATVEEAMSKVNVSERKPVPREVIRRAVREVRKAHAES